MKNYTLITGASSGIGWDLAEIFAEHGHSLIISARTESKLQELKAKIEKEYPGVSVEVILGDLSKADGASRLHSEVVGRGLQVDILVNNAGLGDVGYFHERDWSRQLEMIQVNITALTQLSRLFLPPMIARKSGRILNVSSVASFQPGPLMAVYYATKAYVQSFSEALSEELKGKGVTVTALCPGPTATGFADVASLSQAKLFKAGYVAKCRPVAELGYQATMRGQRVAIHGVANRVAALLSRVTPHSVLLPIVKGYQENR